MNAYEQAEAAIKEATIEAEKIFSEALKSTQRNDRRMVCMNEYAKTLLTLAEALRKVSLT